MVPRTPHYRPEIDGLRALAVLLVIAFHSTTTWVPNGFLGVDLFFVVSGYVVMASLERRIDERGPLAVVPFYGRRVKRLLPALASCTVVTGIGVVLVMGHPTTNLATGCSALFGLSNVALWVKERDYFDPGQQFNAFTHTWSLGVEEQFYLVFPMVLVGIQRLRANRAQSIAGLTILSLSAYIWTARDEPSTAFYLMPLRSWELGLGACVWLFRSPEGRKASSPWSKARCVALFLTSVAILPFVPFRNQTVLTIAGALAFAGLLRDLCAPSPLRTLLRRPSVGYLGRLSYSLYLWHWPVMVLSLCVASESYRCVAAMLSVVLAMVSYHCIENPLRTARWFANEGERPHKVLAAGVLVSAACAMFLFLLPRSMYLGGVRYLDSRSYVQDSPCHAPGSADVVSACLDPGSSGPAIYLMGDSHAGNLRPALGRAATQLGLGFAALTDNALTTDLSGLPGCGRGVCAEDETGARLALLRKSMQPGSIVFFSMARDRIYGRSRRDVRPFRRGSRRAFETSIVDNLEQNLVRFAHDIGLLGGHLVLVEDTPKVCAQEEFAVAPFRPDLCRVGIRESLADRRPLSEVFASVRRRVHNVTVVDPHDLLCHEGWCSNILDGNVIYVDASPHLARVASEQLAPWFKHVIARVMADQVTGIRRSRAVRPELSDHGIDASASSSGARQQSCLRFTRNGRLSAPTSPVIIGFS